MATRRMSKQRRRIGDVEVIDWVDAAEAEAVRSKLHVSVPLNLTWTWNYGSEVSELRALYTKGKRNQWNADLDIDWSYPVDRDDWILSADSSLLATACRLAGRDESVQRSAAFDEVAYMLSQLLHGEQAALQLCGQLTNLCETSDEKWFAASQVADEARHNEVISRFLHDKVGGVYPVGATVKTLLDELLTVQGYEMKTLGMQTLFEGIAMGVMDLLIKKTSNGLLRTVLTRVQQDEARHAAFGVLTMRRVMSDASELRRRQMEDWAFSIVEALDANQELEMLRLLCPKYDLDPEFVVMLPRLAPNWPELNSQAFMHTVVPNLRRVGLITRRTEPEWLQRGLLVDSRIAARAAVG
jgi:hypothetical protein